MSPAEQIVFRLVLLAFVLYKLGMVFVAYDVALRAVFLYAVIRRRA